MKKPGRVHRCELCEQCSSRINQELIDNVRIYANRGAEVITQSAIEHAKAELSDFIKQSAPAIMRETFTAEMILVAREKLKADVDRFFSGEAKS